MELEMFHLQQDIFSTNVLSVAHNEDVLAEDIFLKMQDIQESFFFIISSTFPFTAPVTV